MYRENYLSVLHQQRTQECRERTISLSSISREPRYTHGKASPCPPPAVSPGKYREKQFLVLHQQRVQACAESSISLSSTRRETRHVQRESRYGQRVQVCTEGSNSLSSSIPAVIPGTYRDKQFPVLRQKRVQACTERIISLSPNSRESRYVQREPSPCPPSAESPVLTTPSQLLPKQVCGRFCSRLLLVLKYCNVYFNSFQDPTFSLRIQSY